YTSNRHADVRRRVATHDSPVRQVLIEARIVVVSNDFQRQLGARFGYTSFQKYGQGLISTAGTAAGTDTAISSGIANLASTGNIYPVGVPTGAAASNRYNVNLPVTSPPGRIPLRNLPDHL